MKKTFELEELDCAHCAAKIEDAIAKLDGVNSVSVSFLAQKLTLDADDDKFEDILKKAVKIAKKNPLTAAGSFLQYQAFASTRSLFSSVKAMVPRERETSPSFCR